MGLLETLLVRKDLRNNHLGFGWPIANHVFKRAHNTPMPQEILSLIKPSKVRSTGWSMRWSQAKNRKPRYRESIRRWWDLIHPADRPIAQKYLAMVLERSAMALDAVEGGLIEANQPEVLRAPESNKALETIQRLNKHASFSSAI